MWQQDRVMGFLLCSQDIRKKSSRTQQGECHSLCAHRGREREIDREREREMSLTKTKVHTTGSPISTATTLTEILTASQIRRPSFRHPIFTNMEKKPTKGRTTQTEINTIHRPLQKSRLKLW